MDKGVSKNVLQELIVKVAFLQLRELSNVVLVTKTSKNGKYFIQNFALNSLDTTFTQMIFTAYEFFFQEKQHVHQSNTE